MLLAPLIHLLEPETAHKLGLLCLRSGVLPQARAVRHASLQTRVLGLEFANPVGLAAGFDKNAVAINGLFAQGFGFVEAGTVTPLPQPGNPKPRIFRLKEDEAVINRLGFNNEGLAVFTRNFASRNPALGIAGANIGKNKDSADAVADYVLGLRAVYPQADYITVNISSPNTQGLRALQQQDALRDLLSVLMSEHAECSAAHGRHVPLLLKVAPDLEPGEREAIAQAVVDFRLDGLIVSNTTISRPASLKSVHKGEQGGLSGKPLMELSTQVLKHFYQLTKGQLPLIGVGGIASGADAYAKIRAGATLVQLYSALVYQGFGLVARINQELDAQLKRDGFTHISQAIGKDA